MFCVLVPGQQPIFNSLLETEVQLNVMNSSLDSITSELQSDILATPAQASTSAQSSAVADTQLDQQLVLPVLGDNVSTIAMAVPAGTSANSLSDNGVGMTPMSDELLQEILSTNLPLQATEAASIVSSVEAQNIALHSTPNQFNTPLPLPAPLSNAPVSSLPEVNTSDVTTAQDQPSCCSNNKKDKVFPEQVRVPAQTRTERLVGPLGDTVGCVDRQQVRFLTIPKVFVGSDRVVNIITLSEKPSTSSDSCCPCDQGNKAVTSTAAAVTTTTHTVASGAALSDTTLNNNLTFNSVMGLPDIFNGEMLNFE